MIENFEEALRQSDESRETLVGSQYVIRVLADWGDHLDVSIRPLNEDTRISDMRVSGNQVKIYKD